MQLQLRRIENKSKYKNGVPSLLGHSMYNMQSFHCGFAHDQTFYLVNILPCTLMSVGVTCSSSPCSWNIHVLCHVHCIMLCHRQLCFKTQIITTVVSLPQYLIYKIAFLMEHETLKFVILHHILGHIAIRFYRISICLQQCFALESITLHSC